MLAQGKVSAVGGILPLQMGPVDGKSESQWAKNYFNDVISHPIRVSQIKGQAQISQEAVGAKGKEADSDQSCIQWV